MKLVSRDFGELDEKGKELVKLAFEARLKAYAPYSNFLVGSALVDVHGKMFSGCNVENAVYGAGVCAERVAILKMASSGTREFKRIAVITSSSQPLFPCGLCLQVISEFGRGSSVIATNESMTLWSEAKVSDLYPQMFSKEELTS